MRRRFQLKSKKLLAGPYLFWSVSFIIIPLLMIFYYGLTDQDGAFTFANLAKITTPENLKALGLALLLSLISTLICLVMAYPLAMILASMNVNQTSFIVLIFILPMLMIASCGRWKNDRILLITPFFSNKVCHASVRSKKFIHIGRMKSNTIRPV